MMKPCPFCGSDNIKLDSWAVEHGGLSAHMEYAVMCLNCGAFGPNDLGKSGAEEMWDLRRIEEGVLTRALENIRDTIESCYVAGGWVTLDIEETIAIFELANAAIARVKVND